MSLEHSLVYGYELYTHSIHGSQWDMFFWRKRLKAVVLCQFGSMAVRLGGSPRRTCLDIS